MTEASGPPSGHPTPSAHPAGSPAPQGEAFSNFSFASAGTRQQPATGGPRAAAARGTARGPEGPAGLWPPRPKDSLGATGWRSLEGERRLGDQGERRGQEGKKIRLGAGCVTLGRLLASLCLSPDLYNGDHHYTHLIRLSQKLNEHIYRKSLEQCLAQRKVAYFITQQMCLVFIYQFVYSSSSLNSLWAACGRQDTYLSYLLPEPTA